MPTIIACYKWVPDEDDIRPRGDGSLDLERAGWKINSYDRYTIEAAVRLKEEAGGEVIALSLGGPEVRASAKEALSRGPDRAILAVDPRFSGADPRTTALGLAAAIRQSGPFDLVLCGEGSSDVYAQQAGPRLAALLGLPHIGFVSRLSLVPGGVRAERKLEDGVEVVEAAFPAVVTVLPGRIPPRIPTLRQVMGAAKKEVRVLDAATLGLSEADLAPQIETLSLRAPRSERKQIRVADAAELARRIAAAIR